ncbi:hypothetical protein [Psychromonas aquatilis]|uniref:Integral membrane protein DUF2269 n=1 Tax=Psychromonas aquatilis TaxID=2005072 RepID=A0ABU9GSF8_9GAMM
MEFQYLVIARALHVVAVVLWIGGVAFVATVLIPAIRNAKTTDNKLHLFEMLESKFSLQAKLTTLITGLSGFYMLYAMNLWSTMHWWIYTMLLIWAIFTLVLFVLEPWFLHKWFHQQALKNSDKAFYYLQLMHTILLTVSLLVIFAGVAGAHGLFY